MIWVLVALAMGTPPARVDVVKYTTEWQCERVLLTLERPNIVPKRLICEERKA